MFFNSDKNMNLKMGLYLIKKLLNLLFSTREILETNIIKIQ